jgi:toxin YoeB
LATTRREAVVHAEFLEDLRFWVANDRTAALRVLQLMEAVLDDPFIGIGKPEPLKHAFAGAWSRRITQEHRLVYRVGTSRVDFLQARLHY